MASYQACIRKYSYLNQILSKNVSYDVFVGDSIMEQFPIKEMTNNDMLINRGMSYDTTAGVLRRLDKTIRNIKISRFFILIGQNDLDYRSAKETVENLRLIIEKVGAPETICMSVLPTAYKDLNEKIVDLNQSIESLCSSMRNCEYVNLYSLFCDEIEKSPTTLFYDGTHLEPDGYKIIIKKLDELYSLSRGS